MSDSRPSKKPAVIQENRFHRNMSSICEDELLLAIRKDQQDSSQARAELYRRGWKPEHIKQYAGK